MKDGKPQRPGLRRVDSMDFLDQDEPEGSTEKLGRALRLSTTLQNSAKADPLIMALPTGIPMGMTRSTSVNAAMNAELTIASLENYVSVVEPKLGVTSRGAVDLHRGGKRQGLIDAVQCVNKA